MVAYFPEKELIDNAYQKFKAFGLSNFELIEKITQSISFGKLSKEAEAYFDGIKLRYVNGILRF